MLWRPPADDPLPLHPTSRTHHWLWPAMLLLGSSVVTVAWVVLALSTGRQSGWMALVAAAEAAWMLRLGTLPAGKTRVIITLLAVLGITIAANWGIVAAHIGSMMGLALVDSAQRLGPHLAWTYAGLLNGPTEWLYLGLALLLGWRLAR